MTPNLDQLNWNALLEQIRLHPDPKVRQEATRQAVSRIWHGPDQPEERIPRHMFESDS